MSLRLLPARTLIAASRAASLRTASVIAAQRGFASLTKRLPPASASASTPASTPASASASKPNNDKEENELSNRAKFRQISPSSQLMQRLDQHGYGLANLAKRGGWQKLRARVPEVFVKFPALGFIAGAKQASGSIGKSVPEVAFIGRSNVGKSTLINALGETPHLAKVSSKPGYTQQINFYAAPDNDFNVVDMPGYGFAYANTEQSDSWLPLIEEYLSTRKTLKLLFLLIDARHGIKRNDAAFIEMLERPEMMAKYQIVLTKCDLVPRLDLARRYMILEETIKNLHGCLPQILMVSNGKRHAGMNDLRKVILHTVGCGRKYLAGVKHKEKLKELDRLAENERKEQSKRKAR
ncbi:P-loop containing nucleoside triphosphate hydrolase protein, partial [Ramicandelaber brevisporus]